METKYQTIIENLSDQIKQGTFLAGKRFYSRAELCRKFNISPITAVRVQNGMADLGLLKKIQGRGVFINYTKNAEQPFLQKVHCKKVKKIIDFLNPESITGHSFPSKICSAISSEAAKNRIEYHTEFYRLADITLNDITMLEIDQDAGYIIICNGTALVFHAAPILVNPNIHSVLIDSYIPGSHCVLTDSFDGMGKLVDHAVEQGCRRFVFCQGSLLENADLYNADRRDGAIYHVARHGYSCEVRNTGEFSGIADQIAASKEKTVVMFPGDDLALRFKKYLAGRNDLKRQPLVTGFDDYAEMETGLEHLTTIRVDRERLGREAVRILMKPNTPFKHIVRVPGSLIRRF